MAKYIDRDLIEWYGCDFENASCENRECSDCRRAGINAYNIDIAFSSIIRTLKQIGEVE